MVTIMSTPKPSPRNQSQRAKIIAGFPGVGKSFFVDYCIPKMGPLAAYKIIDLSPKNFRNLSKDNDDLDSPHYPQNYITAIRNLAEANNTVLLINTDPTVRQTLIDNGYRIKIVYPQVSHKNFYIKRYRDMRSDPEWISNFEKDWDTYLSNLSLQHGCRHVVLRNAQNLQGVIEDIVVNDVDTLSDFQQQDQNNRDTTPQGLLLNRGVNVKVTDLEQTITIPGRTPITIVTQRVQDPLSRIAGTLFCLMLFIMVWLIFLLESERRVYVAANNFTRVRILDALELWLEIERATLD
jgi:hypothetical protein